MPHEEPPKLQSSTLPPAQPAYVLRGHVAQVHAVHFLRQNLRLLTGDADGWVILWDVPIKRPVAVWRAHGSSTVLGLGSGGLDDEKIVTHGRDNKLHIWQLRQGDEATCSRTLPVDDATSERKQPWLLHSLDVNALNFCSFTMREASLKGDDGTPGLPAGNDSILIAVPGIQDGFINITALPSEDRIATIPTPKDIATGMLMAVGLHHQKTSLQVLAGYESGHVAIWQQQPSTKQWQPIYVQKPHSQPVLSLDLAPALGCFYTSAADAILARHPLREGGHELKVFQTKHAGQQALTVRSDEKIFATAGWDGRMRVYAAKGFKELAVLKWHKEGCYALDFATINPDDGTDPAADGASSAVTQRKLTVSEQRTAKAKSTHWLAAGSKDGKVSLWDIY